MYGYHFVHILEEPIKITTIVRWWSERSAGRILRSFRLRGRRGALLGGSSGTARNERAWPPFGAVPRAQRMTTMASFHTAFVTLYLVGFLFLFPIFPLVFARAGPSTPRSPSIVAPARRGASATFSMHDHIAATSPARRRGLERGPSSFRTSPTMSGSCSNRRESEPLTDHTTRFFFPSERKQASFDG